MISYEKLVTLIIVSDDKKAKEKNITDMCHVFVTNILVRHANAKQEYLIDAYKKNGESRPGTGRWRDDSTSNQKRRSVFA